MILRLLVFFFTVTLLHSCSGSKLVKEKVAKTQKILIPQDSTLLDKQKAGIDLIATGDTPGIWKLEINFDEQLTLSSGNTIIAKGNSIQELPVADMNGISYSAATDKGPVVVNVFDQICNSDTSGNILNKKITVSLNNKNTYVGCGKYLYLPSINDFWILDLIDSTKQLDYSYALGIPRLEINMTKGKMFGFDGCNEVSSKIEVRGKRIKFSNILSSRSVDCPNKLGKKLYADCLSNQLLKYELTSNRLILYAPGDKKLIFKQSKR